MILSILPAYSVANPFMEQNFDSYPVSEIEVTVKEDSLDIHFISADGDESMNINEEILQYVEYMDYPENPNGKPVKFLQYDLSEQAAKVIISSVSMVGQIIYHFMSGMMPSTNEKPNLNERLLDQYSIIIDEDIPVRILFQGVGNLKWLGSIFYYNEFKGGLGFDISLLPETFENTVLALRLTPVFGEFLTVRSAYGTDPEIEMPTHVIYGTSAGVDISHNFRAVGLEPGFRFYVQPQWNVSEEAKFGAPISSAIYLKWNLRSLIAGDGQVFPDIILSALLHVYERGDSKNSLYSWPASDYDLLTTFRHIQEFKNGYDVLFSFQMKY